MPFRWSGRDTQTLSAGAVAAMFTLFHAGHIDALRTACGPEGTPGQRRAHTLRLPLQGPLIAWALSLRTPVRGNPLPRKPIRQ